MQVERILKRISGERVRNAREFTLQSGISIPLPKENVFPRKTVLIPDNQRFIVVG